MNRSTAPSTHATAAPLRLAVAAVLCWIPLLAIAALTVGLWPALTGVIATQWSGDDVVTRAPLWTVMLLPATGAALCGAIATSRARSEHPRGSRRVFLVCGGVGAILAAIVAAVLAPTAVSAGSPPPPFAALLAPLAFAYGLVPWAVAPREEERTREDGVIHGA